MWGCQSATGSLSHVLPRFIRPGKVVQLQCQKGWNSESQFCKVIFAQMVDFCRAFTWTNKLIGFAWDRRGGFAGSNGQHVSKTRTLFKFLARKFWPSMANRVSMNNTQGHAVLGQLFLLSWQVTRQVSLLLLPVKGRLAWKLGAWISVKVWRWKVDAKPRAIQPFFFQFVMKTGSLFRKVTMESTAARTHRARLLSVVRNSWKE